MPTPPKPILSYQTPNTASGLSRSQSISHSWAASPLAQASLQRDIDDASDGYETASDDEYDDETPNGEETIPAAAYEDYSLTGSYRRPSFAGARNQATLGPTLFKTVSNRERLPPEERQRIVSEERSLLRDNNLIPPKHPREDEGGRRASVLDRILSREPTREGHVIGAPSDTTPLLRDPGQPYGGYDEPGVIKVKWEEAVKEGKISTTWQREAKTLFGYSMPLMASFLLQYSIQIASIFTLGHVGTTELAAVSLASMSANITGFAIYQGLTTSLDTLCAQAYGSGRKKLVGLQMQRMIYFLWLITIPIGVIWLCGEKILLVIIPEPEVARMAGQYLKVILFAAPAYSTFEAGKRFVQAQGLFKAPLYVLLFCAPLNAFLNWYFVWKLHMGFIGAPIAIVITENLMCFGLWFYVYFFNRPALQCWNGFTKQALRNWGPMVKLALPGVVMIEAEVLAFEVLTFASSYLGVIELAAQSVLMTLTSITFMIPFPLSIAASTRVANLIGATLVDAAKTTTRVAFVGAIIVGFINVTLLAALKDYIPYLFTSDEAVVKLTAEILPICAAFQLFDALTALCNGTLRGLGRQHVGGYVQIFCYYVIAMPISMGLAFGLHWDLWGLWTGVALALALVSLIEFIYLYRTDWQRSVDEARARNDYE